MPTRRKPNSPQAVSDPAVHEHNVFARPYATVDVVIFTARGENLEVLLVQRAQDPTEPFPGRWALPGGFVNVDLDDDLPSCARRKLFEKTGVRSPYLEQLGSWGNASRDPRGWSATHVYFALIPALDAGLDADLDAAPAVASVATTGKPAHTAEVAWFTVDEKLARTRLAFDHAIILRAAIDRLRSKVEYSSLPAFLLPSVFTLPQLQRAYEIVLGRPVDKSGFRTRMIAADFLVEVGSIESNSNRPPMGYRLKDRSAPVFFPRTFSPRNAD